MVVAWISLLPKKKLSLHGGNNNPVENAGATLESPHMIHLSSTVATIKKHLKLLYHLFFTFFMVLCRTSKKVKIIY